MSYRACSPVVLVEGYGDRDAVPFLLRRVFGELGAPDCFPASRPIACGDIPKIERIGELEKFTRYACERADGDSVLLMVDCDDRCPKEVGEAFYPRLREIAEWRGKKIGFGFFWREFETQFLYALDDLVTAYPAFGWTLDEDYQSVDWSATRGAKGRLNAMMSTYYYKETRDQARFVSRLDLQRLRRRCRSTEHVFRLLEWLMDDTTADLVYPAFDKVIEAA